MTEQHAPQPLERRTTEVDERGRTLAFTALALALVALMGGGVFASAAQWAFLEASSSQGSFTAAVVAGPIGLGLLALTLGLMSTSPDPLARPVGRAAVVVAGITLFGSLVMIASASPTTL